MIKVLLSFLFMLTAGILLLSVVYDVWHFSTDIVNRLFPVFFTLAVTLVNLQISYKVSSSTRIDLKLFLISALVFLLSISMVCFIVLSEYVDIRLKDRSYKEVYSDCFKVWAARGLVLDGPEITQNGTQNSIESIQRAFDKGAKGTEVDVHYDAAMGKFIVAHDKPYQLKNGSLLTLESLFEATGGSSYYWLDFKKLRHLNDIELAQSVLELERITQIHNVKNKIYVEGEAPFSLAKYRDAGFNTIFDTHPLPDSNLLTPPIINLYKMVYYFGGFTVMAMNYGGIDDPFYGQRTRKSLGNIPVFLYHVYDIPQVLKMISRLEAVRVILVLDHSLDRYGLNACGSNN